MDIQDRVFADLEVPSTSDGSYQGRKKVADANKEHYAMKFEQELARINSRLKEDKTKVSLEATKGAIQLRATLPLKPGDTHKQGRNKKQYKISLGIPANFDGLKTAQEEAHELGKLIARQTFIWNEKYLGIHAAKDNNITFDEFYEQLEKRYFETRKRTLKSENSFNHLQYSFRRFYIGLGYITAEKLITTIRQQDSPSNRKKAIDVSKFICKELDIDIDFTVLALKHTPQKRDIPSDEEIVDAFHNFQRCVDNSITFIQRKTIAIKKYKLIFGLLAVYGLRPREIINKPDLDWIVSSNNLHDTFKVHESNKTGYREVFPFVPEWIKLFDLQNLESIQLLKDYIDENDSAKVLSQKVAFISRAFSRYNIPFQPYDLRHACAIRAHLQGVPIKASADNLGHTIEMHTKVYQKWFSLENRIKAFHQAFYEVSQIQELKDDLRLARNRIAELESEVIRLQKMSKK